MKVKHNYAMKVLSVLLTVVMTVMTVPLTAFADDQDVSYVYNLYVQGVHVSDDNASDILGDGTVSFDPETLTLTLNNADIEMSRRSFGFNGDKNEYGIRANLPSADVGPRGKALTGALTIVLKGDNNIVNDTVDTETEDKYGIIVFGSAVKFTGGGTLNVDIDADTADLYHGIDTRMPTSYDGVNVNINMPGSAASAVFGMHLQYSNLISLTNKANVSINMDKGYAIDNNVQNVENLYVEKGSTFEAISKWASGALHGNNWVKIAQETIDESGVLVNQEASAAGRTLWDGTSSLGNYKYVYIPGKATLTVHWSSLDGVDLMEPFESDPFAPGTRFGDIIPEEDIFQKEGYAAGSFARKPITEYSSVSEMLDDTFENSETLDTHTDAYAIMYKRIDKVEITVEPPVCGTATETPLYEEEDWDWPKQTNKPKLSVPKDADYELTQLSSGSPAGYWDETDEGDTPFIGTFEGGKDYIFDADVSGKLGYTVAGAEVSIKGGELVSSDRSGWVFGKVTAVHDPADPVNENVVKPDCTKAGSHDEVVYCKHCKAEISRKKVTDPALGHDFGEWKVTKEPTTTAEGEETRTCSRCGEKETRPIPKLDPEKVTYRLVKGDGSKWQKGSEEDLEFTFKRSKDDNTTFDHFTGIEIDGKEVDEDDYDAKAGSVIVTLKASYLETLGTGKHKIRANFDDGNSPKGTFAITKTDPADEDGEDEGADEEDDEEGQEKSGSSKGKIGSPKTGDENHIYFWIMLLEIALLAVIYSTLRKRSGRL